MKCHYESCTDQASAVLIVKDADRGFLTSCRCLGHAASWINKFSEDLCIPFTDREAEALVVLHGLHGNQQIFHPFEDMPQSWRHRLTSEWAENYPSDA